MKLLYDFFPIVVFFIVFKLYGIYVATASAIIISALQVIFYWLKYRKFEKLQLLTLVIISIFGGATLILHNPLFIKWKVSVVNWIIGLILFSSQWIGKKNLLQKMFDQKITLSQAVWHSLNIFWILYFLIIGIVNIYVAYRFSTEVWVNFKLFGILGLTLLFVIFQSIYLTKHIR